MTWRPELTPGGTLMPCAPIHLGSLSQGLNKLLELLNPHGTLRQCLLLQISQRFWQNLRSTRGNDTGPSGRVLPAQLAYQVLTTARNQRQRMGELGASHMDAGAEILQAESCLNLEPNRYLLAKHFKCFLVACAQPEQVK